MMEGGMKSSTRRRQTRLQRIRFTRGRASCAVGILDVGNARRTRDSTWGHRTVDATRPRHAFCDREAPRTQRYNAAMKLLRSLAASLALVFAACALAQTPAPVLLVVGDSISASYGLAKGEGWVDLLAGRLKQQGYRERVVNASISGDTTAGGLARLPALLREHKPSIVLIELGGNDALRGGNLQSTRANLDAMVVAAQNAHARPLIAGMKVPPNYGPAYARAFDALFVDVARARRVPIVPYIFEGFGEDLALFQSDRIHPTAAAQTRILDNVWPALVPLLARK
jgi:acyl-CoA thioesterase I